MGKYWQQNQVTFYPDTTKKTYAVVFEASKGKGYKGDIALDDIKVTDGACQNSSKFPYYGVKNFIPKPLCLENVEHPREITSTEMFAYWFLI